MFWLKIPVSLPPNTPGDVPTSHAKSPFCHRQHGWKLSQGLLKASSAVTPINAETLCSIIKIKHPVASHEYWHTVLHCNSTIQLLIWKSGYKHVMWTWSDTWTFQCSRHDRCERRSGLQKCCQHFIQTGDLAGHEVESLRTFDVTEQKQACFLYKALKIVFLKLNEIKVCERMTKSPETTGKNKQPSAHTFSSLPGFSDQSTCCLLKILIQSWLRVVSFCPGLWHHQARL